MKELGRHLDSLYAMIVGRFIIELYKQSEEFREFVRTKGFTFLFEDKE